MTEEDSIFQCDMHAYACILQQQHGVAHVTCFYANNVRFQIPHDENMKDAKHTGLKIHRSVKVCDLIQICR